MFLTPFLTPLFLFLLKPINGFINHFVLKSNKIIHERKINFAYSSKYHGKNNNRIKQIITNEEMDDMNNTTDLIELLLKKFENNTKPDLFSKPEYQNNIKINNYKKPNLRIIINKGLYIPQIDPNSEYEDDDESENYDMFGNPFMYNKEKQKPKPKVQRSENFELITESPYNFNSVGGYESIKKELNQCVDILSNYSKYEPYNVRIPKGLIIEGSPGNGKTLLAKALAGEAKINFIAVSGSEFQDKYVGVGSSRIRELFELAKKNIPCIIFIDEIDALGRKRSGDGESASSERDSTLNELLVALDGFKNSSGIFVIGATNRADLLDNALIRPGRIDKRIFIDNPDKKTRKAILEIHSKGKPYDSSIVLEELVEMTNGFSGAQIENLLNEAMLNALRYNNVKMTKTDIDLMMNKIMAGWQPNDHEFTDEMIFQIAIHELGHAIVGMFSRHHPKMTKIVINLSSPKSPAYTVFETPVSSISKREALFEHLMILLSGRIAEEAFYGIGVSTGAINDFEEALKLAQKMVCHYGMGSKTIYPSMSEKYKELIDNEVSILIEKAYKSAEHIIYNSKELIQEGSEILVKDKILFSNRLIEMINEKYMKNI
jgi:cell division protease FtsH